MNSHLSANLLKDLRIVKLFLLFSLIINNGYSQEWIRYYGTNQKPKVRHCLEHYDKGYILTGSINDLKFGWLVKTDVNGYERWNIKVGDGIQLTELRNAENTADKGLITCGSTKLFTGYQRPFILKLNPCGESEWCRVINLNNVSSGSIAVKPTTDDGYVLLCNYNGNDRIYLFKFDGAGEMDWYKIFSPDSMINNEQVRGLYVDSMNFVITSHCYYPDWIKPYFIQTDTAGNETWRLVYSQHTGLGYVGDAFASVRDTYGNYYAAGRRVNSPELLKFSGQGMEITNVDLFPAATAGGAQTIMQYSANELILGAGWVGNSIDFMGLVKTDTLGNKLDTFLLSNPTNSFLGETIRTYNAKILFPVTEFVGVNSVVKLYKLRPDFSYDSIYTNPFTYDSLCPNPIVSQTILPGCDVITGLEEPLKTPENTIIKLFPNPSSEAVRVEFPETLVVNTDGQGMQVSTVYHKWRSVTLEVFDLTGRSVLNREVIRTEKAMELDVSAWAPGMYLFRLTYHGNKVSQVTLIKK